MPVAIPLSQQEQESFRRSHRWNAVWKAALIAGLILWLWPSGNPWTSFSQPSAAQVMGRPVSDDPSATILSFKTVPAHIAHFGVSLLYAVVLLPLVFRLRSWRSILGGAAGGLVLYGANFLLFKLVAPEFTGRQELNVILAHILFGGIAGGAIRAFLRPPVRVDESAPNPGAKYP